MSGSVLQAVFAEGASPLAIAFPANITAGSTVVVFAIDANAAGLTITAADTHGTLGTAVDNLSDGVNGNSLASFVKAGVVAGADTVTITGGAVGHTMAGCIIEVAGAGVLDGHNAQQQSSPGNLADAISSTNGTNGGPAFMLALAFESIGTVAGPGAGTGFTSTSGTNITVVGWQLGTGLNLARLEWKASLAAGNHAGTFTDGTNGSTHNYDTLMVMVDETAPAATIQATDDPQRNRPGRGPYSLGRFFRPDISAFSNVPQALGTAAITEGSDTFAGTGSVGVSGSAAITENPDTAAGVGSVGVSGSAAITEGADTAAGVGSAGSTGSAAITEGSDTASGTGSVGVTGSAAITESADVAAGTGSVAVDGSAAITEGADTVSASGTATTGADGVAAITEAADVAAGTGSVGVDGIAAVVEGADTASASGFAGDLPPSQGGGGRKSFRAKPVTLRQLEDALTHSDDEFANPEITLLSSVIDSKPVAIAQTVHDILGRAPIPVRAPIAVRYDAEIAAILWMLM